MIDYTLHSLVYRLYILHRPVAECKSYGNESGTACGTRARNRLLTQRASHTIPSASCCGLAGEASLSSRTRHLVPLRCMLWLSRPCDSFCLNQATTTTPRKGQKCETQRPRRYSDTPRPAHQCVSWKRTVRSYVTSPGSKFFRLISPISTITDI